MNPPFFVNLPVRRVWRDRSLLEALLARRLAPELGLDAIAIDHVPLDFHRRLADELAAAGLAVSIHLPFFDIQPGSLDDLVLAATRDRLRRAWELARLYAPRLMIGHASYTGLYVELYADWLERSADTWGALPALWPDHPPLYLENTHERDPKPLVELLTRLGRPGDAAGRGRVGACFDVGHWFSFSGGSRLGDLERWLDALAPWLGHLHLHDNDGSGDQHLGLGQGAIPFAALAAGLTRRGLRPTRTLEPHTPEALDACLAWLARADAPL